MTAVYIIIGIVALALLFVVVTCNGLVRLRNQMENAWAQIDVQLKRRHNLIPNLVNTVKGYAAHERETLEAVTNARKTWPRAQSVKAWELSPKLRVYSLRPYPGYSSWLKIIPI